MVGRKVSKEIRAKVLKQLDMDADDGHSNVILTRLDPGRRYSHTAMTNYHITMASLQPDEKRLPNCACNLINSNKGPIDEDESRVTVIVEHDLREFILCVLDSNKLHQCKLDLRVQAGEQIAFRVTGKIPVQIAGMHLSETR